MATTSTLYFGSVVGTLGLIIYPDISEKMLRKRGKVIVGFNY